MSKRYEGASVRPQALVLSPEAPYPPVGGGAMRTASIIDYLAKRYNVDVITFREDPREERPFPADRVRSVLVLDLPEHSKTGLARAVRNARRFVGGRPPLLDRYSGFNSRIAEWLEDRVYTVVVAEHFWMAPYAAVLRDHADRLVLDMHNVESVLQERTADSESWLLSRMFRRFGNIYTDLEREWVPQFDDVLVTSSEDAKHVKGIAPDVNLIVYPNAIQRLEQPVVAEENAIAFSGNMEYHANSLAIRWFADEIWPSVHARHPDLEWRLIGKNSQAVDLALPGLKIVGPVDDAVSALAAAKVAVVPLRTGSGTRFKIIEAWAAGRAVVSTTIGAEGLSARTGEHLLIADDPQSFGAAIESLLGDEDERKRLGANGRRLYLDRFTADASWRVLDAAGF